MTLTKQKTCPRCGQTFICKPDNINACQCDAVLLEKHHYEFIARNYNDCLCVACLRQLKQQCDAS